jgi:serine/threonine-protein kinase
MIKWLDIQVQVIIENGEKIVDAGGRIIAGEKRLPIASMNIKIGRYEIKAEIGRGGMAAVFQAYDPHFQRDVALKILPRELLHDSIFRARFEREAKTIAALDHPAIVPVYDFGEEDGQPYLVMRFLPGGSLTRRLKQDHFSFAETVRIIQRLAPALDEAHKLGIIHRDLKPDNILFDQRSDPFITDFGIAKLAEDRGSLTSGGLIIGTPAYMSPEQANGDELDGRSDIYSLGVILFEMLTGKQPYRSNTPIGLIMQHITQPVPNILEINPNLPAGCKAVIAKAMAKEPDERFASATALATAFSEAFTTSPEPQSVSARATSTQKLLLKRIEPSKKTELTTEASTEDTFICPKCNHVNTAQTYFCANCSTRLRIDCPLCHTSNRVDETECTNCGADLKNIRLRQQEVQQARKRTLAKRDRAFKEKAARQLRERLEELLNDLDNRKKRASAMRQLNQLIDSAVKLLAENLLIDDDPEARGESARVLGRLCDRPEFKPLIKTQVVEALVEALNDPDPIVQQLVRKELHRLDRGRLREISDMLKGMVGWLKGDE